jgi:molybdopterin molybdotransferase
VPLAGAAGRIIQETITARVRVPESDCAAVDGYAVRVADLIGNASGRLRLAGRVTAGGDTPVPLLPGCCVAVMTGACVPPGTEAVVPLEQACRSEGDGVVVIGVPNPGSGIRRAGADAQPGEVLVSVGTPADPRIVERLAGQGISQVAVPRRARVHVIATGDELVSPDETPGAGRRVASNLPMLAAWIQACGGQVEGSVVSPDDPGRLARALTTSLGGDLVLTTGGTLRGSKDLTKAALADLGATFLFDGVAMRPGSSCAAATAGDATVVCLPGSPGAACVAFAALIRPLLRALHGWPGPIPAFTARMAEPPEPAREETLLLAGVVQGMADHLEFRCHGQGWPALGIVSPSAGGACRDRQITVELWPQE